MNRSPIDLRLFHSDNRHGNFIDAIKKRAHPAASINIAVRSDTRCMPDQIAIRLPRKLRCDPVKEEFVGDAEATALLDRPMRAPWKL